MSILDIVQEEKDYIEFNAETSRNPEPRKRFLIDNARDVLASVEGEAYFTPQRILDYIRGHPECADARVLYVSGRQVAGYGPGYISAGNMAIAAGFFPDELTPIQIASEIPEMSFAMEFTI